MIQEFIDGQYVYSLASPSLILTKVVINGHDISRFLSNESSVGWYDVSKNSGRDVTNADGTMILNVVSTKFRLDLVTRPLTQDEIIEFFQQISLRPTMSVTFLNPFTGTEKTISAYRGDRSAQAYAPYKFKEGQNDVLVELYNPVSIALIEL